jgi:hypothetical protein
VKDPEVLRRGFQYDRGMRLAAQDTFIHRGANRQEYETERQRRVPEVRHWSLGENSVEMDCAIEGVEYRKSVRIGDELETAYDLRGYEGRLFSEWNLSLASNGAGEPAFEMSHGRLAICAGGFRLEASHNADEVWYEQIFSASNTEGGVELAPQGWAVVFAKDMESTGRGCLNLCWKVSA